MGVVRQISKARPLAMEQQKKDQRDWEEFEFERVGADLAARHALKVSLHNSAPIEAVLRELRAPAVVEMWLAPLGRPPSDLTAHRIATTEELAAMREDWRGAA